MVGWTIFWAACGRQASQPRQSATEADHLTRATGPPEAKTSPRCLSAAAVNSQFVTRKPHFKSPPLFPMPLVGLTPMLQPFFRVQSAAAQRGASAHFAEEAPRPVEPQIRVERRADEYAALQLSQLPTVRAVAEPPDRVGYLERICATSLVPLALAGLSPASSASRVAAALGWFCHRAVDCHLPREASKSGYSCCRLLRRVVSQPARSSMRCSQTEIQASIDRFTVYTVSPLAALVLL